MIATRSPMAGVRWSSASRSVTRGRRAAVLAAAVGGVVLLQHRSSAEDYTYVGPGAAAPPANGNWNDPANWNPATGFPTDVNADRAFFTADANATAPGTVVSLNNTSQGVLQLRFSNAAGSYQIAPGGTSGLLNVGAEGVRQTGAGNNEILAPVSAASGSFWNISAGTLRLTNVAAPANSLGGVTIEIGREAGPAGAVTSAGTLTGIATATATSLGTATIDLFGNNLATAPIPTLSLQRSGTAVTAPTFTNNVNIHGSGAFTVFDAPAAAEGVRLNGNVTVDLAGSTLGTARVAFGNARYFNINGSLTVNQPTELNVAGNWVFANGVQNWGAHTITKTGTGEYQLAGGDTAANATPNNITGTINLQQGLFIVGASSVNNENTLGQGIIQAKGGELRIRPFGNTGTTATMDNKIFVDTNDLVVNLDNATLGNRGGQVGNTLVLGSAARPIEVSAGRTLTFSAQREHDLTVPVVQLNGNATVSSNGLGSDPAGNVTPAAGNNVITIQSLQGGAVNYTKGGNATLFVNEGTYTGTTTVTGGILDVRGAFATSGATVNNNGTLRLSTPTHGAGFGPTNVTLASGGRLDFNIPNADAAAYTFPTGSILRLSQPQDTTAGATVPDEILSRFEINADIGPNYDGVKVAASGTVATVRAAQTYGSDLLLNGTVNFDTGGGNLTVSGSIANNAGATGGLTKAGNNALILTGPTSYTGPTQVTRGTLTVDPGGNVPPTPATVAGATGGLQPAIATMNPPAVAPALDFNPGAGNTATAGPVSLNNGTLRARSGIVDLGSNGVTVTPQSLNTTNNALRMAWQQGNPGDGPLQQIGNNNGGLLTSTPRGIKPLAEPLKLHEDGTRTAAAPGNNVKSNNELSAAPTAGQTLGANDNFWFLWTGTLTPTVSGNYRFGLGNTYNFTSTTNVTNPTGIDDDAAIYIDLDRDGVFEQGDITSNQSGERVVSTFASARPAQLSATDVPLISGNTYNVAIAFREGTGADQRVSAEFNIPSDPTFGTLRNIDPSDPAQSGWWKFNDPTGGGTVQVDPGGELRTAFVTGATSVNLIGAESNAGTAVLRLTAAGASDTGSLSVQAGAAGGAGTVDVGANHVFSATSVSVATGGGLTKTGPGVLSITGAPPSTAGTGTLTVAAGTLGGNGSTISPVMVLTGATVSPGLSPGILGTGNIDFADGSTFLVELNGTTVGTQYDQLNVTGTVDLGAPATGPNLSVVLGYSPAAGDMFTIINNDGLDPVVGTFAQGTVFIAGGTPFTINYAGGDGNDVTLTAVPEPAAAGVLALGALGLLARRRRRS